MKVKLGGANREYEFELSSAFRQHSVQSSASTLTQYCSGSLVFQKVWPIYLIFLFYKSRTQKFCREDKDQTNQTISHDLVKKQQSEKIKNLNVICTGKVLNFDSQSSRLPRFVFIASSMSSATKSSSTTLLFVRFQIFVLSLTVISAR